jgi:hypothetical protein
MISEGYQPRGVSGKVRPPRGGTGESGRNERGSEMGREFTEWDRFQWSMRRCTELGCKKWNMDVCCPEMMGSLCNPKIKVLRKLEITEEDLNSNKITAKEVLDKIGEKNV